MLRLAAPTGASGYDSLRCNEHDTRVDTPFYEGEYVHLLHAELREKEMLSVTNALAKPGRFLGGSCWSGMMAGFWLAQRGHYFVHAPAIRTIAL